MTQHDESEHNPPEETGDERQTLTLWQTFTSVLWAMLGVQNRRTAKRDFTKGKASHFIIIGIFFGVLFVLTLIFVVNLVLGDL